MPGPTKEMPCGCLKRVYPSENLNAWYSCSFFRQNSGGYSGLWLVRVGPLVFAVEKLMLNTGSELNCCLVLRGARPKAGCSVVVVVGFCLHCLAPLGAHVGTLGLSSGSIFAALNCDSRPVRFMNSAILRSCLGSWIILDQLWGWPSGHVCLRSSAYSWYAVTTCQGVWRPLSYLQSGVATTLTL